MRLVDSIIQELEAEAKITERLLERVPETGLAWRPHEKSMGLGVLAMHIASIPGFIAPATLEPGFEPRTSGRPSPESRDTILTAHRTGLDRALDALSKIDDQKAVGLFNVMKDGQVLRSFPRLAVYRNFMINHVAHHRGQLTVYLRLLNVPLPSVYGPSADEGPAF
jgi:uncharacterized damage-inducible protein DinB